MKKNEKFSSFFLHVSFFLPTFAIAKHKYGDESLRAKDDARNNIGHYLCQFEYPEPEISWLDNIATSAATRR